MTNATWHSDTSEKVLTALKSDAVNGLSESVLGARRARYGENVLPKDSGFQLLTALYVQLKSPLSLVLIIAGFATLLLGEHLDTLVIFLAALINVTIGIIQEGKAARVFEALEQSQTKHATLIRDGRQQVVATAELVPGDIVVLAGGAAVPADMRLLEATHLAIDESALTGEWLPVEKSAGTVGRALPISEQKNMAWMGTFVSEGSGTGVVVATGASAQFGQIARDTYEHGATTTPLQKSIQRIARLLLVVIAVALFVIFVLGVLRGETFVSMLVLSIAVAVAAMPEGLPAAVTVVLAIGMEAILRRGGLVKSLLAAETLGSTTVILTDKTGTLTEGRMRLNGLYTAQSSVTDVQKVEGDTKELLRMAILASDAFVEDDPENPGAQVVRGRPLERAITEAGLTAHIVQKDMFSHGCERLDFVQFESARRYAISLNACDARRGNQLYVSGSPEHILARSKSYLVNGKARKLTKAMREHFADTQARISAEGMRFTAIAYLNTPDKRVPQHVVEPEGGEEFVFVGLLSFADAIREDVPAAIGEVQEAGAHVIMATGDYPETARAIARDVGIDTRKDAPVLTGAMVSEMDDAALSVALAEHNIVARVLPEQKLRIAKLLRTEGEVVAMTGDGVNDAPALAAADIGVAVGSGTEVAKAAADMVLIDNSFSVITTAIREGRRVVANLRKTVGNLLSTSFTEIVVISGALATASPLPLLPTQILWANMVGEGLMSFSFAFEPAERDAMKRAPERRSVQAIITPHVRTIIFAVSAITGAMLLALYFILLWAGIDIEKIRTVMFIALSVSTILYTFSFKDLSLPIWRIPLWNNRFLLGALSINFVLLVATIELEPLRALLSLVDLSIVEKLVILGIGLVNLLLVELVKLALRPKELREKRK